MICYAFYDSPVGRLLLTGQDGCLTGLYLRSVEIPVTWEEMPEQFTEVFSWLDAYFRGEPHPIRFSMNAQGTPFQKQVWELLLRIPYGSTRTYGDIAGDMEICLGKTKMSPQAVGQAVGRNPISIIIPCHRVIGSGRRLVGYSGGLDNKIWLLRHEGWNE